MEHAIAVHNGKELIVPFQFVLQAMGSIAMIMDSAMTVHLLSSVNALKDGLELLVKKVISIIALFALLFISCLCLATCPNGCSGNGFCDGTLSPPQCRCNPFYVGDDCHSLTTSGSDSQDVLTIVIGAASGAGVAFVIILGAAIITGFYVRSCYKRAWMNRSLNSMPSAVSI